MYKVIKYFHDLTDSKKTKSGKLYHEYKVNDVYPREGINPSEERIAELLGSNNKQGMPLIIKVEEGTDADPKKKPEEPAKTTAKKAAEKKTSEK